MGVHCSYIGKKPPWLILWLNDSWSMILWKLFVSMIDQGYSIYGYECYVLLLSRSCREPKRRADDSYRY